MILTPYHTYVIEALSLSWFNVSGLCIIMASISSELGAYSTESINRDLLNSKHSQML